MKSMIGNRSDVCICVSLCVNGSCSAVGVLTLEKLRKYNEFVFSGIVGKCGNAEGCLCLTVGVLRSKDDVSNYPE
jgi:hypothetical protein